MTYVQLMFNQILKIALTISSSNVHIKHVHVPFLSKYITPVLVPTTMHRSQLSSHLKSPYSQSHLEKSSVSSAISFTLVVLCLKTEGNRLVEENQGTQKQSTLSSLNLGKTLQSFVISSKGFLRRHNLFQNPSSQLFIKPLPAM